MKSKITLSNIEDKTETQLKRIEKKYLVKIEVLKRFLTTANDFEIELLDMQFEIVKEKIDFYNKQYLKVKYFNQWRYRDKCEPETITLWSWSEIKETDYERIRINDLRYNKLKRITTKK